MSRGDVAELMWYDARSHCKTRVKNNKCVDCGARESERVRVSDMFAYGLGTFTSKMYHQPSARSWALDTTDCRALHDGITVESHGPHRPSRFSHTAGDISALLLRH